MRPHLLLALTVSASLLVPTEPAVAYDPVPCGGEGERACGVEDVAFWRNGTGWCDSSLAADMQLPAVLGGQTVVLYAQRSTAWLDLKDFNDITVRNLLGSWSGLGQDLGEIISHPRDWFAIEQVDEVCADPCPGDIDCEICVPIYGPVIVDDVFDLFSQLGNAFAALGPFFQQIGDFKVGSQIPFELKGSLDFGSLPSFPSFDPTDFLDIDVDVSIDPPDVDVSVDIDWDGAGGVISGWASQTLDRVHQITSYLQELQGFFEDPGATCRNWNRHDYGGARTAFQASWAGWATSAQRVLGRDEPLSWQQMIDTHNAYNSFVDGYILPNQYYTLSDQLDLGARSLELDPNWFLGDWRACHGKRELDDAGCSGIDRLFDNALKEIRYWLDQHPNEVLLLRMENYVELDERGEFLTMIANRLGPKIWTHAGPDTDPDVRLPSPREMLAAGRQVVIVLYFSLDDARLNEQLVTERSVDEFFEVQPMDLATYREERALCGPDVRLGRGANMVDALGDPVLGWDPGVDRALDYGYAVRRTYASSDPGTPDEERSFEYFGCDAVATTPGGCDLTLAGGHCLADDCGGCAIDPAEAATCRWNRVEMGYEDKTAISPAEILRVHEARPFDIGTIIDFDPDPSNKRLLDEASASILRWCRVNLISVDYLHAKQETPQSTCELANVPLDQCRSTDRRTEAAVWSWADGDRAQHGDATYQDRAGRWHSADANGTRRWACMRPREPQPEAEFRSSCASVRYGGASTWTDPDGADWCITPSAGAWTDGGRACLDACDGYVFGAPRNGWQAQRLVDQMAGAGANEVWVAVDDIANEGAPSLDGRPWATFFQTDGPYFEGSSVGFSGLSSCDPEGDPLTFAWDFDGGGHGPTTVRDPTWTWGQDSGDRAFDVRLRADDGRAGTDDVHLAMVVANVAPQVTLDGAKDALGQRIPEEVPVAVVGVPVSYAGRYSDVGWLDEQVATMVWGDGATSSGGVTVDPLRPPAARTGGILMTHAYPVTGAMTLAFSLHDGRDTVGIGKSLEVVDTAGAIALSRADLVTWRRGGDAIKWLDFAVGHLALGNLGAFYDRLERAVQQMVWINAPRKTQAMAVLAARAEANLIMARLAERDPTSVGLSLALASMARGDAAFAARQPVTAVHKYWLAWRNALTYGGPG